MSIKVFTIEEANKILPTVRARMQTLHDRMQEAVELHDRIRILSLLGAEEPSSPEHREWIDKRSEICRLQAACATELLRLKRIGCAVENLNHGLVDFYCRKGDRLIFLCWRLGEKEISHWHELNAGFAGRRSIHELEEDEG